MQHAAESILAACMCMHLRLEICYTVLCNTVYIASSLFRDQQHLPSNRTLLFRNGCMWLFCRMGSNLFALAHAYLSINIIDYIYGIVSAKTEGPITRVFSSSKYFYILEVWNVVYKLLLTH